jgi:DNA-binding NarL/FixJ family response regulator
MNREELHLLLVEDEVIVAMQLRRNLLAQGYKVYEPVGTAQAAIESASTYHPDIILMDIRLPGAKDGIDAAVEIRAHHDIPVIFVTGYSDPETVARAQAVSPAALLPKPTSLKDVDAAIATAVAGR